jgi:hypothetical protein
MKKLQKVNRVGTHANIFVSGVGDLGKTLTSNQDAKNKSYEMWLTDFGVVVIHPKTHVVIPFTNIICFEVAPTDDKK